MTRITCPVLSEKVTSAEEAANFINDGDIVGMSGFTGSGYPKGLPAALAEKGKDAQENGKEFGIELYTGASTATDADGVMAEAGVIRKRSPFQSDPALRNAINTGQTDYVDTHLSHLAQQLQFGWFGNLNVAVIEVAAIHPNGQLVPSSAVGNNQMWLDLADKVIIEVNEWQPAAYEGMHDVYTGIGVPPERKPLNINDSFQQIGTPTCRWTLRRSSPWFTPTRPTGTLPSSPPMRSPRLRPTTSSTSCATRSTRAACRTACSPSSPASATSPTRCW